MLTVDPGLTLLAAATPNRDWTLPLLEKAGKDLRYVAIHEYWLPCWSENQTPDYLSCIMHSEGPETTIHRVVDLLDESGHRGHIKIAFDEWNLRGWHHPGFPRKEARDKNDPSVTALIQARNKNAIASQYSMADALFRPRFSTPVFGMPMMSGWQTLHRSSTPEGLCMFTLGDWSSGRLFTFSGCMRTYLESGSFPPRLDAFPSRWLVEQYLFWMLLRVVMPRKEMEDCADQSASFRNIEMCREVQQKAIKGEYRGTVLAGDSPSAFNDIDRIDRVVPVPVTLSFEAGGDSLPPHSITILEVEE